MAERMVASSRDGSAGAEDGAGVVTAGVVSAGEGAAGGTLVEEVDAYLELERPPLAGCDVLLLDV